MDLYVEQPHKLLGKIIIGFEFENTIESEIGKILKKLGKQFQQQKVLQEA